MEFYKSCLGGQLNITPYSSRPGGTQFPQHKDWVMHSSLAIGSMILMASDQRPDIPIQKGSNFGVMIHCDTLEEMEGLFRALGTNGKVKMPLEKTFFSERFGMLVDQFGVHWILNLP